MYPSSADQYNRRDTGRNIFDLLEIAASEVSAFQISNAEMSAVAISNGVPVIPSVTEEPNEANTVCCLPGCCDHRRHGGLDAGTAAEAVQSRVRPDKCRSAGSASSPAMDQRSL